MHSEGRSYHDLVGEETLAYSTTVKAGADLYFSFGIEIFFLKITSSTKLQTLNENLDILESLVKTQLLMYECTDFGLFLPVCIS